MFYYVSVDFGSNISRKRKLTKIYALDGLLRIEKNQGFRWILIEKERRFMNCKFRMTSDRKSFGWTLTEKTKVHFGWISIENCFWWTSIENELRIISFEQTSDRKRIKICFGWIFKNGKSFVKMSNNKDTNLWLYLF
ncbi:unnamed protein product [Rhizophagus irregularis]|nr:unnamed protein product [Rhizophagus irregularis]